MATERYAPADNPDALMKIDIMTLFPAMIDACMQTSVIGRAAAKGIISVRATNIRDFAPGRNMRTDDYPYGGGQGLVMLAEPLFRCHQHLSAGEHVHTILMSAQGQPFTQETARRLLSYGRFILVCGHYEGVDQRFIDECVDEETAIGNFVLTGGALPAMTVADCVCRMVPGVLSEENCFTDESYWNNLLEYPQYTRPEVWHGRAVPPVLLSGHHGRIVDWRMRESLKRTLLRRPSLLGGAKLSREEAAALEELYLHLGDPE
ncbi:MAG: tRNA (guanosine(37)-N1)-methyltransferase TrmD [Clostridiaceae bacterium]|nr:tRNA (guanosine(37)-N1)-methyltransferase TrmD [Clostridiaceae bacterium]